MLVFFEKKRVLFCCFKTKKTCFFLKTFVLKHAHISSFALPQKNITLIVCLMYIVSAFVKIYITVKLVDARSCIIAAVFTIRENVKFLLT